ncbi:MAG: hypothetical protein ACI364_03905 [Coriobacteriales bacterium]
MARPYVGPARAERPLSSDHGFWVGIIRVGVGADSADFAIASAITPASGA